MKKVTNEKTKRKTISGKKKPASTPLQRAHAMVDKLLDAMEAELNNDRGDAARYEQWFGPKGLLASMPKLMQLLEHMAAAEPRAEAAELTREEWQLIKEWLDRAAL